jgi:hypothetical protein
LELQNQELRNQNVDLQAQLSKATHENAKVQKLFATATEQVEQLKDKEEKTSGQLELTKSRHEQDMMTMRKHMAGIQREKSDLLTKVEDLNATMTLQQRKLAKRATLDAIALAQEIEEKAAAEPTIEAPVLIQAPAKAVSGEEVVVPTVVAPAVVEPKIASLARETSFAHQQSIISELQSKLSKEITEKEELITEKEELLVEKDELVKMLADREETIETMRLEGVAVFEPTPLNVRSSLGPVQSHGSRIASDMDVLDDVDGYDHRDVSMSLSESESHDLSNGRGSPFPTGGLFAELAQATSTTNVKATEYKDQEVMTEPIESWIHTVPGFTPPTNGVTSSSTVDSLDKDTVEENDAADAKKTVVNMKTTEVHEGDQTTTVVNGVSSSVPGFEVKEVVAQDKGDKIAEAIIIGKPGTETKHIPIDTVPSVPTTDITTATAATALPAVVASTIKSTQDTSVDVVSPAPSTETLDSPTNVESAQDTLASDVQYTPNPAAHSEEGNEDVIEPAADKSAPRATKSNVEDERRHTCDMSQTISEPTAVESPPPVPAVPADLAEPATDRPSLKPEDREFRVSFGSAFGGDQSATDTGRIKSVYQDSTSSAVASLEQSQDEAEAATTNEEANVDKKHPKLETTAPLAVSAVVAAVTTAAAVASTSLDDTSTPTPAQLTTADKDVSLPTSVTVQTEKPLSAAGEVPLGRPSTTVVEVSSHTTYTYAAPSTSQVNLTHLNNGVGNATQHQHVITDSSGIMIGRHPDYRPSPNGSISSMSTDYNQDGYSRNGRRMSTGSNFDLTPTDPTMIQLITQTMIGDYLWKYTRRRFATMMNEKMHWRYVWVHPYTKTMHWSLKNPGSGGPSLQSGKSGKWFAKRAPYVFLFHYSPILVFCHGECVCKVHSS